MESSAIRELLLQRIPDAVVRDDVCDAVRVFWRGRTAFAEPHEGAGIQIRVALPAIPDGSKVVPDPHLLDFAVEPCEAADKIAFWLQRIAATRLDAY